MELLSFTTRVVGNFVEIIPNEPLKDNSTYEIRLIDIKSQDGTKELSTTFNLTTKLTPLYTDVYAVRSIILDIDIPDDIILYHIREASRFADYIKGVEIGEDNIPFEVSQFVKYKAAHECLLRYSIQLSSTFGMSGTVGSVTFNERESTRDISNLLDVFSKEVAKWIDEVKGFKLEGRAKMKTAVKGGNYAGNASIPDYQKLSFKRGVY